MSSATTHSSSLPTPLYRRVDAVPEDNGGGGRQLRATTSIPKGTLVFCERPLLALVSTDNHLYNSVCHGCKAFAGGPDEAMRWRFRSSSDGNFERQRQGAYADETECGVYFCRSNCGYRYCSKECEEDTWHGQHKWLCTGRCGSDESHPLVDFKKYAVETNEILLLVAEWWISQHAAVNGDSSADDASAAYTDFQMEPWWDVEALHLRDKPGGFVEIASLQKTLQAICVDAAAKLNRALSRFEDDDENESNGARIRIPPITPLDISRRIGACSQNAMGIRQRHFLCRVALDDAAFRARWNEQIVQALADAGFIGGADDDDADGGEVEYGCRDDSNGGGANNNAGNAKKQPHDGETEVWDYTVDEIAGFLATLFVEEEGLVRDIADEGAGGDARAADGGVFEGDDLDYVFPPLDGTAMYATICKMNHSCEPNIIVLYKPTSSWGARYPLTAYVVALKDIAAGEELTISYINKDHPYRDRQQELINYGFICQCYKCLREQDKDENETRQTPKPNGTNSNVTQGPSVAVDDYDMFGDDDDDDDSSMIGIDQDADENHIGPIPDSDSIPSDKRSNNNEPDENGDDEGTGAAALERIVLRLDTKWNHSGFGAIPRDLAAPVLAYVLQESSNLCDSSVFSGAGGDPDVLGLLRQCVVAAQEQDFCLCSIVGRDLESLLNHILHKEGRWPSIPHRVAYYIAVLSASVGLAHQCGTMLESLVFLDKGMIMGLPRNDDCRIDRFVTYVEQHASSMAKGPHRPFLDCHYLLPDFCESQLRKIVRRQGLGRSLTNTLPEEPSNISFSAFKDKYLSMSRPVVVRKLASSWKAIDKWRNLQTLVYEHGHRLVPIEIGSMLGGTMQETLCSFREFVASYLVPNWTARTIWSLSDATDPSPSVCYLAQHPLLSQIPRLWDDVDAAPALCGPGGPNHVCVWIGTGGTRTPLHYDSYDNLFVQLVGAKLVRLYDPKESSKLYLNKSSAYGLQGNMSSVDCESEDWERHPLAKTAEYSEVVLFPGDSLFIPSKTWHYVRSLTISMSVNYWW